MEKEIDKKNLVLKEDESIGTVQIADDVVAMIASLAATEVDGVSAMAGNITVDLAVTMEYDYNIPTTCQAVQQKVKNAIEYMTGLTCSDVNIRIAGVNMKKDK